MCCQVVFGSETECALVVRDRRGSVIPVHADLAAAVVENLVIQFDYLPSQPPTQRLFLANGACIYADLGGHPEIATAECSNPIEFGAHTIAMRRALARSVEAIGRNFNGLNLSLFANNIDYAIGGAQTFGYHLNIHLKSLSREKAAFQLSPLLVSMPIISGTGKVSFSKDAKGFELSQRAVYMNGGLLGEYTTDSRAMITAKDESLSDSGTRLHIICLDTPKSIYQLVLVPAILAMTIQVLEESGQDIADTFELSRPDMALQQVSLDPSLSAKLKTKCGDSVTALDIQEHYVSTVSKFFENKSKPDWAGSILALWREILQNLRKNPFLEVHRLDWIRKLVLFTQLLEQEGLTWREFSKWSGFILPSVRRMMATWRDLDPVSLSRSGDVRLQQSVMGVLEAYLVRDKLSWTDFPRIWKTTNRMCSMCLHYHQVTCDENRLNEKPFDVKIPLSKQMIERAMTCPPSGTRAQVRGNTIKDAPDGTTAGWDFIRYKNGKELSMVDPWGKNAIWKKQESSGKKESVRCS